MPMIDAEQYIFFAPIDRQQSSTEAFRLVFAKPHGLA
jgi:hypothetical protein